MSFHQRSHRAQVWDGGRGSGEEIQKGVMSPIPDINEEKGGTMGVLVYRRMAFRALRGHSVQSVVLKIYRETFHLVCFPISPSLPFLFLMFFLKHSRKAFSYIYK